jgi:hypothetical protein
MERVRVLVRGGLAVSPNSTALLPVAVPRLRIPGWGWLRARGRPRNGESRSRTHCLEREQVVCSLALLACGVLFGLFVGGFVGFMENATPHGGAPHGLAQLATSDVRWVAMMRQSRVASGGRLQSVEESERVSFQQPPAAGALGAAGDMVSAASVFTPPVRESSCLPRGSIIRRHRGGHYDTR